METYWCEKKISIIFWINNRESFGQALVPCKKTECDQWMGGECIQINTTGKLDRPQVFSRQD
jgi:hypothetical protein